LTTFKPRQRVLVRPAAGKHITKATVVRRYSAREIARSHAPDLAEWLIVRFDDGGTLACHQDSLQPVTVEAQRVWIQEEAERLCMPAWATPRWQRIHGQA
jgi:hypothetical protein